MKALFNTSQQYSLFVSDVHLCIQHPQIIDDFLRFLANDAIYAQNLFVLGDLFEYWIGDDDLESSLHQQVVQAFKHLASQKVNLFFMVGNRDFLIGEYFAQMANVSLLPDPYLLTLYGTRILLSHGDSLCLADIEYQTFKQTVRDPKWQTTFLNKPLEERRAIASNLRQQSEAKKSQKKDYIMDVDPQAVIDILEKYQYPRYFIHGHTHRPNVHSIKSEKHLIERIVLGDWYDRGNYLAFFSNGTYQRNWLSSRPLSTKLKP